MKLSRVGWLILAVVQLALPPGAARAEEVDGIPLLGKLFRSESSYRPDKAAQAEEALRNADRVARMSPSQRSIFKKLAREHGVREYDLTLQPDHTFLMSERTKDRWGHHVFRTIEVKHDEGYKVFDGTGCHAPDKMERFWVAGVTTQTNQVFRTKAGKTEIFLDHRVPLAVARALIKTLDARGSSPGNSELPATEKLQRIERVRRESIFAGMLASRNMKRDGEELILIFGEPPGWMECLVSLKGDALTCFGSAHCVF